MAPPQAEPGQQGQNRGLGVRQPPAPGSREPHQALALALLPPLSPGPVGLAAAAKATPADPAPCLGSGLSAGRHIGPLSPSHN